MSETSKLDRNWPLFWIINKNKVNIYEDFSSNIFSYLYNSQQDSLLPELIITLIILFWILKILLIWGEFLQNIILYDRMEWRLEK